MNAAGHANGGGQVKVPGGQGAEAGGAGGASVPGFTQGANLNELALIHLRPYFGRATLPSADYAPLVRKRCFDFSLASLASVDGVLDSIHAAEHPDYDDFLARPERQSFLFGLGFYVGTVLATHSHQRIHWLDYAEVAAMPGTASWLPRSFETAVTCVFEHSGFYAPLAPICARLFDGQGGVQLSTSKRWPVLA